MQVHNKICYSYIIAYAKYAAYSGKKLVCVALVCDVKDIASSNHPYQTWLRQAFHRLVSLVFEHVCDKIVSVAKEDPA